MPYLPEDNAHLFRPQLAGRTTCAGQLERSTSKYTLQQKERRIVPQAFFAVLKRLSPKRLFKYTLPNYPDHNVFIIIFFFNAVNPWIGGPPLGQPNRDSLKSYCSIKASDESSYFISHTGSMLQRSSSRKKLI